MRNQQKRQKIFNEWVFKIHCIFLFFNKIRKSYFLLYMYFCTAITFLFLVKKRTFTCNEILIIIFLSSLSHTHTHWRTYFVCHTLTCECDEPRQKNCLLSTSNMRYLPVNNRQCPSVRSSFHESVRPSAIRRMNIFAVDCCCWFLWFLIWHFYA